MHLTVEIRTEALRQRLNLLLVSAKIKYCTIVPVLAIVSSWSENQLRNKLLTR